MSATDRAEALRAWAERNGYGAKEPAPAQLFDEPDSARQAEFDAALDATQREPVVLNLPTTWDVYQGDCVALMRALPEGSVDAVVTDPPYEIGFMGKTWDSTGVAYDPATWAEALRVLKPGGHLLAFAATRTYHRIAVAIEDAGFEIRDMVEWIYGTGFPKSLDVSKAIDKAAGAEREVVGSRTDGAGNGSVVGLGSERSMETEFDITAPATPDAARWDGWGTALKPAHEPIVLARKPLTGTVASNVLEHGTGALNIDGTRVEGPVGSDGRADPGNGAGRGIVYGTFAGTPAAGDHPESARHNAQGRWPANLILGPDAAADLDESVDSVSRFFYVAKPSRRERDAGLEDREAKGGTLGHKRCAACGRQKVNVPGSECKCPEPREWVAVEDHSPRKNSHPTVKPVALMRYLTRLVTPPGGLVLDPFAGSGSTGMGAVTEGFRFLGLELDADHVAIARARIEHAAKEAQ